MLFRTILYMLLAVVLISLLRMIIGVAAKILGSLFHSASSGPGPVPPSAQNSHLGGDLHRDPVCGTFVAESTPYQRTLGGRTVYFCSEACREKHSLVTN